MLKIFSVFDNQIALNNMCASALKKQKPKLQPFVWMLLRSMKAVSNQNGPLVEGQTEQGSKC